MFENNFKWYVIHAVSGHEKKVAQKIKELADKANLGDLFDQVVVPTEGVTEVRRGQKVSVERKFLPGYLMIKMVMNEQTWHLVKNTPKVSGFLGAVSKPQAITEAEAQNILKQIEEGAVQSKNVTVFEVGESVRVIDGPFESFVGNVEEVDFEKQRLKVSVSIFGRSTPVELEYTQVDKV
jgi:transcriptional antiterminator NusG